MLGFNSYLIFCTTLLLSLATASPHGESHGGGSMHGAANNMTASIEWSDSYKFPSYFRHDGYHFWIYAHIGTMIISWIILLPLSVMFSIARSRYTIILQFCFFALHSLGVTVGTIYNANTPDLYEHNSHHIMGWIFTWISLVWIVMGVVDTYTAKGSRSSSLVPHGSSTSYQPVLQDENTSVPRRWSDDSGHETERNSSICSSTTTAAEQNESIYKDEDDDDIQYSKPPVPNLERQGFLNGTRINKYLSQNVGKVVVGKTLVVMRFIYSFIERTIIIIAFALFCSGFVTYAGIFRAGEIFNGLAHFVKGGIFFWIGIIAIARWAGAFADFGWAWNVKPQAEVIGNRKASFVSSEFVESTLICIYGVSNVWLEHLAAWGEAWSPMDYEHISITILFFGGGLLGLLVESQRIRNLLNTGLLFTQPTTTSTSPSDLEATPSNPTWDAPFTSTTPLNPLPAVTILLLGGIMGAHAQHSGLASSMHIIWGGLFAFAAAMRIATYLLHYLSPPTSYLPSRPPTELVVGFALVAGGFMFMISARDITDALEGSGADAMVAFVVSLGFAAVVCAGVVVCMAAKGWAVAREKSSAGGLWRR